MVAKGKSDFLDTAYLEVLLQCTANADMYDFEYYTEYFLDEALRQLQRHMLYLEMLKQELL